MYPNGENDTGFFELHLLYSGEVAKRIEVLVKLGFCGWLKEFPLDVILASKKSKKFESCYEHCDENFKKEFQIDGKVTLICEVSSTIVKRSKLLT